MFIGKNIKLSIFGESHGSSIGIVIEGIPPGIEVDMDYIYSEMMRRMPGKSALSTPRKEKDYPIILSGVFEGRTTGTPLTMMIKNEDKKSRDYHKDILRPSHADYTAFVKYNGFQDYRGGGHFSGRLTAPLVFVGALCKSILSKENIYIGSHLKRVGSIEDRSFDYVVEDKKEFDDLLRKELPVIEDEKMEAIKNEILQYKEDHNSIGAIIECKCIGIKPGLGDPFFHSIESKLSSLLFSIPAVKGVEFGLGFDFSKTSAKEVNDEIYNEGGRIKTYTNNNGGINGGITNGMPIIFRVAIKPTPSIKSPQRTVDMKTGENIVFVVDGRHDPCIAVRASVVVESMAAIAIYDNMLG